MKTPNSWQKKLPMQITMSRVYILPLIIGLMWPNQFLWNCLAAGLFVIASITDYYDGHFARKYGAVSNMGKFMDPIADKILVTSVLVMLLSQAKIDVVMVIIILMRDTFIGGIRSVAAADQIIIDAKATGKWKTALQMIAIPLIMINEIPQLPLPIGKIGWGALWITVFLSVLSGWDYFKSYKKASAAK